MDWVNLWIEILENVKINLKSVKMKLKFLKITLKSLEIWYLKIKLISLKMWKLIKIWHLNLNNLKKFEIEIEICENFLL